MGDEVCFVCHEPRNLIQICRCSLAHFECVRHVIETVPAHGFRCPACSTVYNITRRPHRRRIPNMPLLLAMDAVACVAFALLLFLASRARDDRRVTIVLIPCVAAVVTCMCAIAASAHAAARRRYASWCWYERLEISGIGAVELGPLHA